MEELHDQHESDHLWMRGKDTGSQAGQWLGCHPTLTLALWTCGRWGGGRPQRTVGDLLSNHWRNPVGRGRRCWPGGGFSRNTAPPGWPRAGHPGIRGADSRAAGRGSVASASAGTETRLSDVQDTLSLFPPSLSPFRALWRVPPVPPGRTTQSPPCPQAPPRTEAEAEGQNPEGKQSGECKVAGTCCRREVDPARSGRGAAWGRWPQ